MVLRKACEQSSCDIRAPTEQLRNSGALSTLFHSCDHNMTVTLVFPLGLRTAMYPPPPHDVTTLAVLAHVNNCKTTANVRVVVTSSRFSQEFTYKHILQIDHQQQTSVYSLRLRKCYKSADRVKKKSEKFQEAGRVCILLYLREGKLSNCFFFFFFF